MIDPVFIAAVIVVGGGAVAISARNGHVVALGLLLALAAAPLVASPLPDSTAAAARIIGALLAAYLLWAVTRVGPVNSEGSAIGIAAEVGAAATAFVIGLRISPVDPLNGPLAAQAAAVAVLVLAVVPLTSQDVFRLGLGSILLTLAGSLFLVAWVGPTPPLTQLALTGLIAGIAGATGALISRTRGIEENAPETDFTPEPGDDRA
jgi:hypothetical protein